MSHDTNGIPPADREFNELFRAANSNQSGHAPSNSKLNSVKNNPSRQSVKHSDFFVSSVSRDLSCSRDEFFRSETVDVSVVFSGMNEGFRDEIRHNPNNFTWYVNDNSKHLLKIEPYTISSSNSDEWVDGGTGSYKITIRHVGNNCYDDEDAYIHCKFKDDFNETLGATNGYNVELSFKIVCKALAFQSNLSLGTKNTVYDNELEISSRRSGMNNRSYNTARAKNGRRLRSALGEDQDMIINTSKIFGQSTLANNLIDRVTIEWEKFDEDTDTWNTINMSDNKHYMPYNHTTMGNIGQLEQWYYNEHYTSKETMGRLNIQGLGGTGLWRAKLTITGDKDNRFTCVIRTNQTKRTYVYERIQPFTLQGQGWECGGVDAILNVNPVVQERISHKSYDVITNKQIRYTLYKHNESGVAYVAHIDRDDNGAGSFYFKVKNDGFYSVQAVWFRPTSNSTSRIQPGDRGTNSWGTRWATDRINTDNQSNNTPNTLASWYNRAAYVRKTLTPPGGPASWTMSWNNMSRTDATWTWSHIGTQTASYRTYIVKPTHRDSSRTSGDEGYQTIHEWKEIGDVNTYNVTDLYTPRDTHGGKSDAWLDVRVKITGDLSKIAPGDTSATCLGPATSKLHQPIGCVHISPRMPVPALTTTSTMTGRLDPTLRIDWGAYNTWNTASQAAADLKRTTRENWCHVSWKYADESDETVNTHWRDQVSGWEGAKEINGLWYSKIEDRRAFSADFVYERAVIVRYRVITYYRSDDLTCTSTAHERIHRTIDPNRVYSYTPGTTVPTKFEKKKHYGFVSVGSSRTAGSTAGWNSYAHGIMMDNISGIKVTKVHQSATLSRFKNGAVAWNRSDHINNSLPSGASIPSIDVVTKHGNTTLKGTYDVKQTDTTTYSHGGMSQVPPYTIHISNRSSVRSPQGKDFYKSSERSYSRKVTK